MYDPSFMIDKFRLDALGEGIDIDKDKNGLILLQVAKDPCIPKPAWVFIITTVFTPIVLFFFHAPSIDNFLAIILHID